MHEGHYASTIVSTIQMTNDDRTSLMIVTIDVEERFPALANALW